MSKKPSDVCIEWLNRQKVKDISKGNTDLLDFIDQTFVSREELIKLEQQSSKDQKELVNLRDQKNYHERKQNHLVEENEKLKENLIKDIIKYLEYKKKKVDEQKSSGERSAIYINSASTILKDITKELKEEFGAE